MNVLRLTHILPVLFMALLLGSIQNLCAAETAKEAAVNDLTKSTPAKTDNSYNLGPSGALGWMQVDKGMTLESRQILVTAVDKGSPADGTLEVGDVILGVFGKPFTEDARRRFGNAIGEAESAAGKGILPLTVWRKGTTKEFKLKLQVMGSYSDTAPYKCPKSAKILDQGLAALLKIMDKKNMFHINELALLASGRPEHLATVRASAQKVAAATPETEALWKQSSKGDMATWYHGYNNLLLCEYFLSTGDKSVLPAIRSYSTTIARGQGVFGTWGHGYVPPRADGQLHGPVPPYGPVNAAGLPCFISLVLAEKCGVNIPEIKPAIAQSNAFFGYYVGKGQIPYGEHPPGIGHDDNGKTSMTALAFALQGKKTETQFFTKMVTASYESREYGHTGNGFSYLWGPIAANAGGPKAMAAFMKELRWYYDLARRWDGTFVNIETGGGTTSSYHGMLGATGYFLLNYSAPLKKLLITGREAHQNIWLSDPEVAEAIAAERRLGDHAHAKRSTAQLLDSLDSWSPSERFWSAQELGRRQDKIVPQLLEMLRSKNPDARCGAVTALGQLKSRAAPALDAMAKLLFDDNRWLRVQTAEALRNLGAIAKPVATQMLKALAGHDSTDGMQFAAGSLAFALFYPGGAQGPAGILSNSLDGIPKEALYPAIRSLLINPDSAARGCARSAFTLLTVEDARILAPEIFASIRDMAPANTMFSKGVRLAGIQMLERLHAEEGIPLTMMMLRLPDWGKAFIVSTSLEVLKKYGGAAKSELPELKKLETNYAKMRPQLEQLKEVIAFIEKDSHPRTLIRLQPVAGKVAH